MVYNDKIIDHNNNPRNVGSLDQDSKEVGTGLIGSPSCGDVMRLQILVRDDIIVDAKFKTFGCGSAIAASSLATEMLIGKSIKEVREMIDINRDIADELSLPRAKHHCSVLARKTILAAINDYCLKNDRADIADTGLNTYECCKKKRCCEEGNAMNENCFDYIVKSDVVVITDRALERMARYLYSGENYKALVITAEDGGCAGKKYAISVILNDDYHAQAEEIHILREIKRDKQQKFVVTRNNSLLFIAGMCIDYKENETESGFVFSNPNAATSCGCGESFNVR